MSLETQIAGAVTEARKVFDLVTGQFGKWDGQVKAQINVLNDWKKSFIEKKDYMRDVHVATNLIKNPLFIEAGANSLSGWHSIGAGITMEVVHPYTRGFSSPYTNAKSANHVDSRIEATVDNPFWAGVYRAFGGAKNFSSAQNGGLNSGWDYVRGNILKVTYDGSSNHTANIYFEILNQFFGVGQENKLSAFIFVEKGIFYLGNHAGYAGAKNNSIEIGVDSEWQYVEQKRSDNDAGSGNNYNNFCFGFNKDIPSVVYIAIPNLNIYNKGDNKVFSIARS